MSADRQRSGSFTAKRRRRRALTLGPEDAELVDDLARRRDRVLVSAADGDDEEEGGVDQRWPSDPSARDSVVRLGTRGSEDPDDRASAPRLRRRGPLQRLHLVVRRPRAAADVPAGDRASARAALPLVPGERVLGGPPVVARAQRGARISVAWPWRAVPASGLPRWGRRAALQRAIGNTDAGSDPDPPSFEPAVAYLSMEVAIDDAIPTYCGGLGVLAGDHLRAAADLRLPIVGVTLCYKGGYFRQRLDEMGNQLEDAVSWSPRDVLEPLDARVSLRLCGRPVTVRGWRHRIVGCSGYEVPVLLLDTDLEENEEQDRAITDQIYSGDRLHRLCQEAVLGLGGMRLLGELGWGGIPTIHLNEGHCALAVLALLRDWALADGAPDRAHLEPAQIEAARARCVFTTHTPVPEGHDRFPEELVRAVLGDEATRDLIALGGIAGGELNMTRLGVSTARFANAVSLRHGDLARAMFPGASIRSITNGVHAPTWVAPSTAKLLDRHVPSWRQQNARLRYVTAIPLAELEEAHAEAKRQMVELVVNRTGVVLDPAVLTLGIARRAAPYKRVDLLLSDPARLAAMAERVGPLQIVYSGKAHPQDEAGKKTIVHVFEAARALQGTVQLAYVPDYDLEVARVLCAGADVWINTPARPSEASGTSGMKAALNGVPSLSVLDGWWLEGHVEGVTGWSIGDRSAERDDAADAEDLYAKLESVVAPLYYRQREELRAVGRFALALNGSFFTTERMTTEYATLAYDPSSDSTHR